MASFNVSQGLDLLVTARYSDFEIGCDNHVFAVHRNILHQKSDFFARSIEGAFREATDSCVTIHEASPVAVACVVLWMYTFQYNLDMVGMVWSDLQGHDDIKEPGFEFLTLPVLIYELGERLLLPDLKIHVTEHLVNLFEQDELFKFWGNYPPEIMTKFLTVVYARTPRDDDGLRVAITTYCVEYHEAMEKGRYVEAMKIVQANDKVGWKIGMAIQLKAERAEEEAQKREAEVSRQTACCHSSREL